MATVGVLALQGDFAAHAAALRGQGLTARLVRREDDFDDLAGIVLPGGESTTMLTLLGGGPLEDALVRTLSSGLPVLATCAGVILLAREVRSPSQRSLNLLDVAAERNAYGRQLQSSVEPVTVTAPEELGVEEMEGVFIRAPRIVDPGAGVRVLAERGGDPVLVRQGDILAATFHPELSAGSPVLALFAARVRGESYRV